MKNVSRAGRSYSLSLALALAAAPIALMATQGCTMSSEEADTGSAEMIGTVAQELTAAEVTRVRVTITGPGIAQPIVHELVKVQGQWRGTLGAIPVGAGRTFTGEAFNGAGTVVYQGATSVGITKGGSAVVALLMQQKQAPNEFRNSAPRMDSMTASSGAVTQSDSVALNAAASDADGHTLTYAWSATGGTFTSTNALSTQWTAPQADGTYDITIRATDPKGAVAALTVRIAVAAANGRGNATVTTTLNTWPEVTNVNASPTRINVGETTTLSIVDSDADGDALSYAWSAVGCTGTFSSPTAKNPTFTLTALPEVGNACGLLATVTDGRGGVNTGNLTISTGPAPAVAYLPEVDSTFQSAASSDGADTITFRIGAHDPQSGAVGFSWSASAGTLAAPTTTGANSEVVWSAPSCLAAPATIIATVTSATGTKQHAFSVTPTAAAACCLPPPAGLVGWWRGESNDPGDHLGINSTGLGNGLTYGAGKVGQAYYFTDPTTRVEATTTGFPTGSADRTIEQWIRITAENQPGVGELFFSGYGGFGQYNTVFALGADANTRGVFFTNWGSGFSGNVFPLNEWHHLAVTYSGAEIATLYFDGGNVATAMMPNLQTAANTKLYWGRYDDYRHFTGAMDELSVYNRALSQSEISAIVNAGSKGKCQ